MKRLRGSRQQFGGSAPATPGFNAVAPEWQRCFAIGGCAPKPPRKNATPGGWGDGQAASPAIPAAESTLGLLPSIALSSARVFPEWTTSTLPCNTFTANGNNPLNFVSQLRGSLQSEAPSLQHCSDLGARRAALRFRAPFRQLAFCNENVSEWERVRLPLLRISQADVRRLASVFRAAGVFCFPNEYSEFVGKSHDSTISHSRKQSQPAPEEK